MSEQLGFDLFNRVERLTVKEAVPIYWLLEGRFLRGKSHKSDLAKLTDFLGQLHLEEITAFDVKNYRSARKSDEIKDSTINKEHSRLTRLINAFGEWQREGRVGGYDFSSLILPRKNPGELVPKADETQFRRNVVVTPERFARFLDYAHPDTRTIAILAVLTLLRRRDIELLSKDALNQALDAVSGLQSKTGKPYNVPATLTIKIMFAKAERTYVADFTNHRRRWKRACTDSGVWFWLMDLRRTGATHLLLEGVDLVTIQRLLGHADIKMTMAYLNPPAKISHEAGKKLERKFVTKLEVPAYDFLEN